MPQLDPSPWFILLAFSWLVFLAVIPYKVMAHTFSNEPTMQDIQKCPTNPWIWPWP
uniref:ATP synthase complex subunit 8 n=1 Tax=Spinachia spinachia TaxID=206126 RepID=B7XCC4_9TELE|nr:ATP synthase F0 subunit 8 [Spinachia spinachia]QHN51612.1 ATP synthase F0 subunit 8 [Spinachia spinachia]BAG83096.1 ATPase subunit 8 [Spinachia spinachia]